MTRKIVCVPVGTSLFEAHELMAEKRIRHLPVIDEEDNLIGILSQRDLNYVPDSKNLTVEMMMNAPVECIDESMSLRKAIFVMLEKKISSLIILNSQSEVTGIVTTDDLLWYLAHLLAEETEANKAFVSVADRQTVGEIANELSNVGI